MTAGRTALSEPRLDKLASAHSEQFLPPLRPTPSAGRLDVAGLSRNRPRVSRTPRQPSALTIAGSDSGGGAGVQIDLKVFASLGVHGTSALTCVTAQNPGRVLGVQPCSAKIVRAQLDAVFEGFPPKAVKTGMLWSAPIIRVVARFLKERKGRIPLVVDPVMVATSGATLLKPAARRALFGELLPLAALATPNLDEAEILIGGRIADVGALRAAARTIHGKFGCAALVKGGHLRGMKEAVDFFYDGREELMLTAPFVKGASTHGTGCSYSAAITAHLAQGRRLCDAVAMAKEHITGSIAGAVKSGRHSVLNSFWKFRQPAG